MAKKADSKPRIVKYMRDGTTTLLSTGNYADRKRTGKTKRKRARQVAA
ncbi:hypothetical protein [Stenotrophomonas phage vB_SmaS_P15]|uniref:Uncharacterized protein n=1 Tax=Stenotrophomonas phage vB_SmaS_P15 TaxID=2894592 RepID=A0AAE9C7K6_9CAUD|nr:hypothetical protein [Stenotrophomonas phage vB_SmaS_P15]